MTPSKAVLVGYNKNKVFNIQQAMNGNSHGENGRQKARPGLTVPLTPSKLALKQGTTWDDIDDSNLSEFDDIFNELNQIEKNKYYSDNFKNKYTNKDSYIKYGFPDYTRIGASPFDGTILDSNDSEGFKSANLNAKNTDRTAKVFKGSKMGADWGTADYIGLGANILGSILSQTINKRGLSSLRDYAPERPLPYVAGKLITNYNINPQLSNLERSRLQAYRSIDRDTVSSVAANQRRNDININTTLAENELYNKKYQTEAEMLNKDTLNQQDVANKSIAAYNDWRENYNKYMAAIAGGRSESNVAMIQGIGSSIGNFLQQGIDRHQMGLNRRAYLATADKGNEMILNRYGLLTKKEQEAMYIDALNRNDIDAANYWSNYISPRRLQRISLKRV